MKNDVSDFDIYFVAGFNDADNQFKEVDLIPNVSKIKVTNENKKITLIKFTRFI